MSLSYLKAEHQHGKLQKRTHLSFLLFSFSFPSSVSLFCVVLKLKNWRMLMCIRACFIYACLRKMGARLSPAPSHLCSGQLWSFLKIYTKMAEISICRCFSDAPSTREARINHLKRFEAKSHKAVCRRAGQGVCDLNPSANHTPALDLSGTVHIRDQRSIEHTWPADQRLQMRK